MKSFKGAISTIAIAALCYSAPSAAQERGDFQRLKGRFTEKIVRQANTGPGGFLELATERGNIEVATWDSGHVRLEVEKRVKVSSDAEAREIFEDFAVYLSREDNEVYIRAESQEEREHNSLRVDFKLTVPQKYGIDVSTSGGNVSIGRLDGDVKAKTSGGNIKVDHIGDGSVDVQTSGGNIDLKGIAKGNGRAQTSGGNVSVGDVQGDLHVQTSGGTIKMGRVGGAVEAQTAGGSISLEEAGGGVKVQSAGGSIHIGPSGSAVEVQTAGGSIHIGPSRGKIKAQTAGGSIEVEGSGGPVEVQTAGGNVRIDSARGAIEAQTAGGSIEAKLLISEKKADTHCDLETIGGDVTIHLPGVLAATIDAELEIRRRVGGDYRIYSDFPLVIKDEDSNRISGRGDINGGGDLIKLRTTNGDIHIRLLRQ